MKHRIPVCLLVLSTALSASAQEASPAGENTWTAPVPHLFFHPAIAFPGKAFSATSATDLEFIDSWFCTAHEIKAAFQQLYARGYVLVDIYDTVDVAASQPRPVSVPAGKKPFVLSIDDLNYYPETVRLGTNRRLFVDPSGRITALGSDGHGKTVVSHDNEVVTILENFLEAHPDFSVRGARGIIALTGYYGFMGWATHLPDKPGYEAQLAGARSVAETLKARGWRFASHSWSHRRPATMDDAVFRDIETRWRQEANVVLGPVDLYIYPFGLTHDAYSERMAWLKRDGFKVFFGVGVQKPRYDATGIHLDRINIDGKMLRRRPNPLSRFLSAEKVIDPLRPEMDPGRRPQELNAQNADWGSAPGRRLPSGPPQARMPAGE